MKRKLSHKNISYLIFAGILVLVAAFRLTPALLTGLVCYVFLEVVCRALTKPLGRSTAKYASLAVFLVVLILTGWMMMKFVRQTVTSVPVILARLIPVLNSLSNNLGFDFQFDTIDQLRTTLVDTIQHNLGSIARFVRTASKEIFMLLMGSFAAVFYFMDSRPVHKSPNLYDALGGELERQTQTFIGSFGRVMGAQVLISAINTTLTAVFLLAVGIPYVPFLVLTTFLSGLLPIIGNLISNTVILGTALTLSNSHALAALVFLAAIHKGEYFLNSKIVGSNVEMPMWQTLLSILLGEVVFGLAGIPLAPAFLHYIRREMRLTKA